MTTVASQITSLTIAYSIVYSGANQRKHQSSASLAFVRGIHRDRWIPRTKGQLRGKCFHVMMSSCDNNFGWRPQVHQVIWNPWKVDNFDENVPRFPVSTVPGALHCYICGSVQNCSISITLCTPVALLAELNASLMRIFCIAFFNLCTKSSTFGIYMASGTD